MADGSLTKPERDALLEEINEILARRFPDDDSKRPPAREDELLRERYYLRLGEYSDRLPRMTLSVCPYCASPLKRAFDPFGLDGLWWHVNCEIAFQEPAACRHFQVLLGALDLHGRAPSEARIPVQPGPPVPFVVPDLLRLPGMKAVMSSLRIHAGDTAYPIAYFSDQAIDPANLHQTWCRDTHWFKDDEGNAGWLIANSIFDFELEPHFTAGRLLWTDLSAKVPVTLGPKNGACPLLSLRGDRERQELGGGERELTGLPTGDPVVPFGDD